MLELADVTVRFGARTVLDRISLELDESEIVGLLGPSGSGKSTLLRIIAGLHPPDAGSVRLAGRDLSAVPTHERGIGMVFQDEQLFPHLTVGRNVAFGLEMAKRSPTERRDRVAELLAVVGLAGFEARSVTDLSGGERKRVALARSLSPAPKVLLLDEPLTGLDRELHDRLAGEVGAILRRTATTSLLVTHDADEARAMCDRVVELAALGGASIGTVGDDG